MQVQFETRTPPAASTPIAGGANTDTSTDAKTQAPVDYVNISGHNGKDVVSRPATDEDRQRFRAEYAEFKGAATETPPKDFMPGFVPPEEAKAAETKTDAKADASTEPADDKNKNHKRR